MISDTPVVTAENVFSAVHMSQEILKSVMWQNLLLTSNSQTETDGTDGMAPVAPALFLTRSQAAVELTLQTVIADSSPVASSSTSDAADDSASEASDVESGVRDFSLLLPDLPPVFHEMLDEQRAVLQSYFSQQLYQQLLSGESEHLLVRLKDSLDLTPMVRICQGYRANNGLGTETTHTIEHYCRGLILRHLYDLSFRLLCESVRRDWLYRWFVGYPLFGPTFDHTTLADFSKWVENNQLDLFFVEVLRQIYEDFPEEKEAPQMGDTFAMQANAAQESLVRRMRHTCHRFLTVFADVDMNLYSSVMYMIDTEALFGKAPERSEFYLSPSERAERACKVGLEAAKLIRLARPKLLELESSLESVEMARRLNQLDKILNDEFDIKYNSDDVAVKMTVKKKYVKGAYRIISATDPEATYRVHGEKIDFGFNIQVAATKNFVTGIVAETGCSPDSVTIPAVLTYQYTHFGFYPYKFIYDQAAGTGKLVYQVLEATDGQTQLVARMVDYSKRTNRYAPADFTSCCDGESMTCPNGQTTDKKYRHGVGDGFTYRFTRRMCEGCPLLTKCRGSDKPVMSDRNVYISDYREPYIRAVSYNKSDEFKLDMKLRAEIERIIAGLVLHNGARRARSRGLTSASFQAKMSGMAYNIKRFMKLMAEREMPISQRLNNGKYDLPDPNAE